MAILSNEGCVWLAHDDPICAMDFTETGFTEYYGDIETSCTLELYSIEASENGRSGTWRVIYEDGTAHDARFTFTQDSETGVYVITSSAFPSYDTFETKAFTSGDVLAY